MDTEDNEITPDIANSRAMPQGQEEPSQPVAASAVESKPLSRTATVILATLVSSIVSCGSLLMYDRFFAQKIMTVNMTQYLKDQSDLYFAGKITRDELAANFDRFSQTVKAQPKNKVILLEDVVANGAEKLRAN